MKPSQIGLGPIQERLGAAYVELHDVKVDDMPDSLRDDYKAIMEALTSGEPEGSRTAFEQMPDDEARETARKIMELEDRFDMFVREREAKQKRSRKGR